MTITIAATESLNKFFITALLLSGSLKRAEAAMLDGIQSTDLDDATGELSNDTVRSILWQDEPPQRFEESDDAASLLPIELRRVLRMTAHLRRCFVLRFLMGLPRERCAVLLNVDVAHVDNSSSLAVQELANVANR